MQREGALDAHPEGLLADGERLARAGPLPLDHDPLEDLDPRALALDHLEMDTHGVSRLELREIVAQLGALELFDDLAHRKCGRSRRGMLAGDLVAQSH